MRVLPAVFLACLAPSCACLLASDAGIPPSAAVLHGEIRDSHYLAPGGLYRVAMPVAPMLGGTVHDTPNVVTFRDGAGLHLSVACFPLDLSQQWERDTRGGRDYLVYFYTEVVFREFASRYAGAANEQSLYSPELRGGTLFVFTLLPGGSALLPPEPAPDTADPIPVVAKRGTALFLARDCIFIVSLEASERITQRSAFGLDAAQENQLLRDRLTDFLQRLQIPAVSVAVPSSQTEKP